MLIRFSPFWLEEPVLADDREAHVRVRQGAGIPVAAGETMYTRYEFADFLRAGALDVVQADIVRVGGFTEWLKIAKLAESFNLPVAPHYILELSVHALCGVPNGLILEDLQGGSLTDLGVLAEPIRVERGELAPSARPGHGIVLDPAALRRYEVTGKVTDVTPART
jgi:L-alanine-DL-glutamate epimerase-like enolase superfamily enzyme